MNLSSSAVKLKGLRSSAEAVRIMRFSFMIFEAFRSVIFDIFFSCAGKCNKCDGREKDRITIPQLIKLDEVAPLIPLVANLGESS